jgi:CDP-6-deoxy-D-xylo-4-hexulose-3-dehydrase
MKNMEELVLREKISELVKEYYQVAFPPKTFIPTESKIPYAGRVFDEKELQALVNSSLDFWLTAGRYTKEFETEFAKFSGKIFNHLVNSGSSANLLAMSALMSPLLGGKKLNPGDEVITVAAGFPTTVNPIIQCGLKPVFIDVDIGTYNINIEHLKGVINKKTKAIFIAQTLGNPFDMEELVKIAWFNGLYIINDSCDALGSKYKGNPSSSYGYISTFSFYPAHHITMGEGGCVSTNDEIISKAIVSLRDWGKQCFCGGGQNNVCGHRFDGQHGDLPVGYDHKYVYSHIGYNLKATDMQAAIGVEQLKKLPGFIAQRKLNFKYWYEGLRKYSDYLVLPRATEHSDPAWFAFPITVKDNDFFARSDLLKHLSLHKIDTRNLFAGNIIRQPAYADIDFAVGPGGLINTDIIMNNTFFLGTYPGLTTEEISYTIAVFDAFFKEYT